MSIERREPTLGGGVEIPEPTIQATATSPKSVTPAPLSHPSSGSAMAWFAFILAVLGLSTSGYLYWQGQQYRLQANTALVDADTRLARLEKRLDFTDEESSQSVEAIRVKLKWADSEIRKLWGVANDRNRKAIAAQKKQISNLNKKLATAAANAKNAITKGSGNAKLIAGVDQQLQSQLKAQAEVAKTLVQAEAGLQSQGLSLERLLKDVKAQAVTLDQLQNGLLERVQMNEEALESITVYRKTTNRELLNIKKRLAGLSAKPAP